VPLGVLGVSRSLRAIRRLLLLSRVSAVRSPCVLALPLEVALTVCIPLFEEEINENTSAVL
jgi:hypothetical protein